MKVKSGSSLPCFFYFGLFFLSFNLMKGRYRTKKRDEIPKKNIHPLALSYPVANCWFRGKFLYESTFWLSHRQFPEIIIYKYISIRIQDSDRLNWMIDIVDKQIDYWNFKIWIVRSKFGLFGCQRKILHLPELDPIANFIFMEPPREPAMAVFGSPMHNLQCK